VRWCLVHFVGTYNEMSLMLFSPKRFEVQIEVPKPRTVEQRIAILKVHTESMVKNGRVLVKDAPYGSVAWKRLQASVVFILSPVSFRILLLFATHENHESSFLILRKVEKKSYPPTMNCWISLQSSVMACQAQAWRE
jgi:hypothetical protein